MLNFSPWSIEQTTFSPSQEAEIEKQLAFSNGYISQYAYFEEHFSGEQSHGTYLRSLAIPIPAITPISVRLHEERLDLHTWEVKSFYRCLHRQKPLLERRVEAISPTGHHLQVSARRVLSPDDPHLLTLDYEVRSVNYTGPISLLALLGDAQRQDWIPVLFRSDENYTGFVFQHRESGVYVASAMSFAMEKNGVPTTAPVVHIEKRFVAGYAVTEQVVPGDVLVLHKRVAVGDSINYPVSPAPGSFVPDPFPSLLASIHSEKA